MATKHYVIVRAKPSAMWLKGFSPTVTWGPQHQARKFRTRGEARAVLEGLKSKAGVDVKSIGD